MRGVLATTAVCILLWGLPGCADERTWQDFVPGERGVAEGYELANIDGQPISNSPAPMRENPGPLSGWWNMDLECPPVDGPGPTAVYSAIYEHNQIAVNGTLQQTSRYWTPLTILVFEYGSPNDAHRAAERGCLRPCLPPADSFVLLEERFVVFGGALFPNEPRTADVQTHDRMVVAQAAEDIQERTGAKPYCYDAQNLHE